MLRAVTFVLGLGRFTVRFFTNISFFCPHGSKRGGNRDIHGRKRMCAAINGRMRTAPPPMFQISLPLVYGDAEKTRLMVVAFLFSTPHRPSPILFRFPYRCTHRSSILQQQQGEEEEKESCSVRFGKAANNSGCYTNSLVSG